MRGSLKYLFITCLPLLVLITACGKSVEPTELIEVAASEQLWTGVAVSDGGRIFVNYPRWSMNVPVSVAELNNEGNSIPFPNQDWNNWTPGMSVADHFVCVQSVYIDKNNYLWILDSGLDITRGILEGAPKLIKVDLAANEIIKTIIFDVSIALPTSYLNDVRVDTELNYAYITDSGNGAIIVINLESGKSKRVLGDHPSTKAEDILLTIEGKGWVGPDGQPRKVHSDGIALSNSREYLYYQALTGRSLYKIKTEYLRDNMFTDEELGDKVELVGLSGACDGIAFGPDDNLYLSSLEFNAIRKFTPDGKVAIVVCDEGIKWPDSFSITKDGVIYFTTSQLHLGAERVDPYKIYKIILH